MVTVFKDNKKYTYLCLPWRVCVNVVKASLHPDKTLVFITIIFHRLKLINADPSYYTYKLFIYIHLL